MKVPVIAFPPSLAALCAGALMLSGCGVVGRLKAVGRAPELSAADPVDAPTIEPSLGSDGATHRRETTTPAAAAPPSASLFRAGAGAFLGDQRASRRGDLLTVRINVADRADVGNSTTRSRGGAESAGIGALLGLETAVPGPAGKQVAGDSKSSYAGNGAISRSETITMTLSAIVTDVLPNGNLVIRGRQEIRVNYELRELVISGIVRPQDILRDNSVRHTQIAEARISYGGRGQLTQAQQARWGQQIFDALFPF